MYVRTPFAGGSEGLEWHFFHPVESEKEKTNKRKFIIADGFTNTMHLAANLESPITLTLHRLVVWVGSHINQNLNQIISGVFTRFVGDLNCQCFTDSDSNANSRNS